MAIIKGTFETAEFKSICNASLFTCRGTSKEVISDLYRVLGEKAAKVESLCAKQEKLEYGKETRQYMLVFYPHNYTAETEVVIFFHGGYWQEGCAADYRVVAVPVVDAGRICILMNRILCPEVRIGDIIDQDRKAMQYICKKFNRASSVVMVGHSSGGHECAMLLSTSWADCYPEVEEFLRAKLKRVLMLCAVCDVTHLIDSDIDEALKMRWDEALAVSPMNHLKRLRENMKHLSCDLYFVNVQNESPTILKWEKIYEKELKADKIPFKSITLPNLDHFNLIQNLDEKDFFTTQLLLMKKDLH